VDGKNLYTRRVKCLQNLIKKNFEYSDYIKANPDMTTTKGFIIGYINWANKENRPVYQKDIERDFQISRSTASEFLDSLEQSGIIKRVVDEVDQRKKQLFCTEKGHELMSELDQTMKEVNVKMLEGFSDEEKEVFKSLLERMINNLKKGVCNND